MRATIWIRNEDVKKWEELENKSEFVSEALGVAFFGGTESPNTNKQYVSDNALVGVKEMREPVEKRKPAPIDDSFLLAPDWSGDQGLKQPEVKPALRTVTCKVHGVDREICKLMKH